MNSLFFKLFYQLHITTIRYDILHFPQEFLFNWFSIVRENRRKILTWRRDHVTWIKAFVTLGISLRQFCVIKVNNVSLNLNKEINLNWNSFSIVTRVPRQSWDKFPLPLALPNQKRIRVRPYQVHIGAFGHSRFFARRELQNVIGVF